MQLSAPDADGNHGYGLINDYGQTAAAKAQMVIAEVNEQVPFTHCDALLPASRIDVAVVVSHPPIEVKPAAIGDTDRAIAKHAAEYISDRSVLQSRGDRYQHHHRSVDEVGRRQRRSST